MPGEPGPKGELCILDLDGNVQKVAWNAFKDQDGTIMEQKPTPADQYKEYMCSKW